MVKQRNQSKVVPRVVDLYKRQPVITLPPSPYRTLQEVFTKALLQNGYSVTSVLDTGLVRGFKSDVSGYELIVTVWHSGISYNISHTFDYTLLTYEARHGLPAPSVADTLPLDSGKLGHIQWEENSSGRFYFNPDLAAKGLTLTVVVDALSQVEQIAFGGHTVPPTVQP